MKNLGCTAEPCPILLNATCVFYTGVNLLYTGILTNNNLQTALEKIDLKFKDASIGYIFQDGVNQVSPGDPVTLGGIFTQDVTISNGPYNFLITNNLEAGAHVTTGGNSSQFVKGDGSLDGTPYQPAGNYITSLTGDGFANGPGVATFTLDNVNPTTGVFGSSTRIPIITTNSKGLITNITSTAISLPSSTLIFQGDVNGSGTTGSPVTLTITNVNPDVYLSDTVLKFAVNGKGLITSASSVSSLDILSIIGYTPVPDSRTLTINGQSYDLTANRTWTTVSDVSVVSGFGITASVANSNTTPVITINNDLPDLTVTLNSGLGINVTGSYPNFTITNTAIPPNNPVSGTGTQNYLTKWSSGPSTIVDSLVYDNGSGVMINTTTYNDYKFDVNGSARVKTNLVVGPINAITVDTNYGLRVNTPMSGAANTFGVFADGEIQSDSTSAAYYFRSVAKTAAASFTIGEINHFTVTQGAFGAGSTVTSQYGFRVFATMISGTTDNRGFFGQVPLDGTKNWNLYMSGTAPNYLAGALQIGPNVLSNHSLRISRAISTATYVVNSDGAIASGAAAGVSNYVSGLRTSGTFTLQSFVHYLANEAATPTTITSQICFWANSTIISGTNNFGFRGSLPSNTNNWNLYMEGSAKNYLAGTTLIGTTSDDTINKLQVTGSVKATQYRLSALNTAPASATDTGTLGEIRIDANYIYICVATNTWKRSAIATW